ncbi:MAG: hypothetical protein JSR18_03010 [Proteobacteria bacterium]|nr:hypothetical protein [Pseudomonadota bacterium]
MRQHVPFALTRRAEGDYSVDCDSDALFRLAPGTTTIRITDGVEQRFPLFDVIRWAAPLVCAQFGIAFLHAAAVASADRAFVFMGQGGAGKSTLARLLADAGARPLADDALICAPDGSVAAGTERDFRAWCEAAASSAAASRCVDFQDLVDRLERGFGATSPPRMPVDTILFLGLPRAPAGRQGAVALSAAEGFHRLVQQAFGAIPDARTWSREAGHYGRLAATARCWSVHVVDGLDALATAIRRAPSEVVPGWPQH